MAWISGNRYLTLAEMQNNAELVAQYGYYNGWTLNAISAILGNMQAESSINPGIWESLTAWSGGYGLVQWTPYTKYSNWATSQGYAWQNNGNAELERISYEAQNGLQWFYNAEIGMAPPITFQQFLNSTDNINTLSNYWLWFYEHPADPYAGTQATRQGYTQYWYQYLTDNPPDPDPPDPPDPGMEFPYWLLFKFKDWMWWN